MLLLSSISVARWEVFIYDFDVDGNCMQRLYMSCAEILKTFFAPGWKQRTSGTVSTMHCCFTDLVAALNYGVKIRTNQY